MADRVWFKPRPGILVPDQLGGFFPPEGGWTERSNYIERRLLEVQKDGSVGAGAVFDRNPFEPEPTKPAPQPMKPEVAKELNTAAGQEPSAAEVKHKKTGR